MKLKTNQDISLKMMNISKNLIILYILIYQSTLFAKTYDAELQLQHTDIFISNNHLVKNYSFSIKINNRAGEKYAKVSIPYSKMEKISKLEAFVQSPDGNVIRKLKKSEITDKSAIDDISFYTDDFVKEFTLTHNVYPYFINFTYQIT